MPHKPRVAASTHDFSIGRVEAEGSKVQGHPHFKKEKEEREKERKMREERKESVYVCWGDGSVVKALPVQA